MPSGYSFDASWEGERARLARIESWLDPHSIRVFEELGVQPGWRCLDVAAGGGSMTQWLCDRVGPRGSVVAVDADTRFVEKLGAPNLEVWRADVVHEPLPEDAFDLVHTRFLLQHLAEREQVLAKLARALKPGGLLIVFDSGGAPPLAPPTLSPEDRNRFDRFTFAFLGAAAQTGWDLLWAPNLPFRLTALGLGDVRARAFREYVAGSEGGFPEFMATSIDRLRERLIATGHVTAADLEIVIASLRDPLGAMITFECWVASGRRPA
jgi:SAM-dependent methyltransferase